MLVRLAEGWTDAIAPTNLQIKKREVTTAIPLYTITTQEKALRKNAKQSLPPPSADLPDAEAEALRENPPPFHTHCCPCHT